MARGTPGWIALVGALLVLAGVGRGSLWVALALDPGAQQTSDFQILHAAGQGLAEGLDIHDPRVLDQIGQRVGRPVTPFCAALPGMVGVFGLFGPDLGPAYESWLVVTILAAIAAALALAACLDQAIGRSLACALALLVVGLPPSFWHSLAMNSTNLLALAALSLAWWAGERHRVGLEGLALALAILVKTSPALVLLTMVMAGRLAPVLWACGWLAATMGGSILWLGWEIHESWLTRVLPVLGYSPEVAPGRFNNALHAWNLSPNGLLTRAALGPGWWAAAGAWLVTGLVLLQLWGAVRGAVRRARGPGTEGGRPGSTTAPVAGVTPVAGTTASAAEVTPRARTSLLDVGGLYALSVAAMFLVSSVTWPHHLVLAAVPAVWLLRQALGGQATLAGRTGPLVCSLAAWSVLALPLGLFDPSSSQPVDIPLKTGACLLLFAGMVALFGTPPEGEPKPAMPERTP